MKNTANTRRRFPIAAVITGAAALFIGVGIGSSSNPATATEPVVETITETVEVETTPEGCFTAIGHAEDTFRHLTTLSDISSRAIDAAVNWRATELDQITEETNALADKVRQSRLGFDISSELCTSEQS